MSWTDRKPFVVTELHIKARWGGRKNRFRCGFCGYTFKVGDTARWVYTNDTKAYGNPFICSSCDDIDNPMAAVELWKVKYEEYGRIINDPKWWWFNSR